MQALARMDSIAYVRFASVYKDFRKPEDFNVFLEAVRQEVGDTRDDEDVA
jgi:transcriptional repressor NrdR